MTEKNLVEETLIQIQNLENVINENAKEILHSTMKEEISELVKESMNEADEDDDENIDVVDTDFDDEGDMPDESEEDDDYNEDDIMPMDNIDGFDGDDDQVIDLTDASDDEVLKVFKAMSSDDEITVTQDGDYIHLVDNPEDNEYLIQTESEQEESYDEMDEMVEFMNDDDDEMNSYGDLEESEHDEDELEETIYEVTLDESEDDDDNNEDELEETIYELEMSDDESDSFVPKHNFEENYEENEEYTLEESKSNSLKNTKPKVGKGAKTGSASKFSYKKSTGGFKEKMKQGTKGVGMGKAKFEFKESEVFEMPSPSGKMPKLSKAEAMEAARTYGTGWRKGALKKGARAGQEFARTMTESVDSELTMLRSKNEEYRKALNLFRDKLNEVAVFNSNLAYATRLFTEHSTSKQEKINILRRFDSAESIKESKALYKTIKEELSGSFGGTQITETIERVIEKEQSSGSAVNLIESKTYENPQFLRMKDIMSKIIK